MKTKFTRSVVVAIFLIVTSCNSSGQKELAANNPSVEKKEEVSSPPTSQDADLTGEWEMVGYTLDTNDNLQVDEEERKNLKKMSFEDYMKLNADGTGLFTVAKLKGRYEAKPKDKDGKNFLTWYDSGNGRHRVGTIVKVTKNELHINERDGHGLFIWKRL